MESGGTLPFVKNLSLVSIVSQSNNSTHPFSLRTILILFSHQRLGLLSELFPSGSNTLFSILFSKNFRVYSSLEVNNKVSTLLRNKTQINIICVLMFLFIGWSTENKTSWTEWQKAFSYFNVIFYLRYLEFKQKVFGCTVVFILLYCPGFICIQVSTNVQSLRQISCVPPFSYTLIFQQEIVEPKLNWEHRFVYVYKLNQGQYSRHVHSIWKTQLRYMHEHKVLWEQNSICAYDLFRREFCTYA